MTVAVRQLLAAEARLGEGVIWDAGRRAIWFVDIKQSRLWHVDPASGRGWHATAPEPIGWALPAERGLLLCGLKDGLYIFDPRSRAFERLVTIAGEPSHNRLNDACTDPLGRVWFGSMDDGEAADTGRFYVFDRGEVRPAGPSGIAITNGPAVDASGGRIFFTDTLARRIMVADLGPDGVGEVKLFTDTARAFPNAHPDGPVVDGEGYVWSAFYGGGCVARFSPDGALVATVPIPARDVTKLAFGGEGYTTAFVTTATKNMGPVDMERYPLAGSLFAFDAPVAGFAPTLTRLA